MSQPKYDKPKSEQKACQRMLEIMPARPEALSHPKVNKRHIKPDLLGTNNRDTKTKTACQTKLRKLELAGRTRAKLSGHS